MSTTEMADAQLTAFMDRFGGPVEELDPDLQACLTTTDTGMVVIRHPLHYSLMHAPFMNRNANLALQYKREALAEAMKERDYSSAVYLHERPYRLQAFSDICWNLRPHAFWELLSALWTDCENHGEERELWRVMLTADHAHRWAMMTADERVVLRSLGRKAPIWVHRGYTTDDAAQGFSWTLNLRVARWFSQRYRTLGDYAAVATGVVDRENVIAYQSARNEEELIILPEHVNVIKTVRE